MANIEPADERGTPSVPGGAGPAVSVFSGAGIGLMVGVLLALSASPTVGIFIGALGSGLAALLGLNDSSFSQAKGLRIGSLGFAVLVGLGIGLYARTHDSLAPSLETQRQEYVALGFTDREALDILRARRLGAPLQVGGAPGGDGKPTLTAALAVPAGNTLLFSDAVEISACGQLQDTGYDKGLTPEVVVGNFQLEKGWKSLADATRARLTGTDQKQLLFIARDAVCGFNGLHPPKVSAAQCRDLESQFASVPELQPVLARVRKEITAQGQPAALDLLGGVLCPTNAG